MVKIRLLMTFLAALLPASRIKNFLLRLLGHNVHPSAKIYSNLLLGEIHLSVGMGTTIRRFNVFRDTSIKLDQQVIIGSFNWFSSAKSISLLPNYKGTIEMGRSCVINSRNYFDCSGGIYFGEFSDLAGVRSTFISHYVDTKINSQVCKAITIGDRTMLSSNIYVAPGANVGSKSLVAMGTVLIGTDYPSESLIAGVPGKFKSKREGTWFERSTGPSGEMRF